jgi:hypothetical protein
MEAHLEVTVGIEEQVGGLEISVKDVGCMEGFEATDGLVDEVLAVIVAEFLSSNHTVTDGRVR